ncbi:unnamed protein product, partial [Didymodactylos carnosus]
QKLRCLQNDERDIERDLVRLNKIKISTSPRHSIGDFASSSLPKIHYDVEKSSISEAVNELTSRIQTTRTSELEQSLFSSKYHQQRHPLVVPVNNTTQKEAEVRPRLRRYSLIQLAELKSKTQYIHKMDEQKYEINQKLKKFLD